MDTKEPGVVDGGKNTGVDADSGRTVVDGGKETGVDADGTGFVDGGKGTGVDVCR